MDLPKTVAVIDQEVRRLIVQGLQGSALAERMIPYWSDMHTMWSTLTDRQLLQLIEEYPYFGRFGELLEDLSAAAATQSPAEVSSLPQLPEHLKGAVTELLKQSTRLEGEFRQLIRTGDQATVQEAIRLLFERYREWTARLISLMESLPSAGVPELSQRMLVTLFGPISSRLNSQFEAFLE